MCALGMRLFRGSPGSWCGILVLPGHGADAKGEDGDGGGSAKDADFTGTVNVRG